MKTLLTVLFTLFLFQVLAQTQDSLVSIETTDGNEFIGQIVSENEQNLVLKTENLGEITILKTNIRSREYIGSEQIKEGEVWFENPQATRYFWSPNGYGLKAGEGYYQNIWVFWNQFTYGVSDNLSIGGGIVPLFLLGGGPTPIFLNGKVSLPVVENKVNLGVGALVGAVIGEEGASFGIVYGVSTFGGKDQNLTVGLGYAFAGGEWASSPLINVSGMIRASSRMYFITENYYVHADGEGVGVIGLGGRWLIKKASLDFILGFPFSADMDTFIAVPALGFVIPFGKTKI